MNLQAFFTLWQDVGLILYAILNSSIIRSRADSLMLKASGKMAVIFL